MQTDVREALADERALAGTDPIAALYAALAECVTYDPQTGGFAWKRTRKVIARFWEKRAGHLQRDGYIYIRLHGKRVLAHRLAWLMSFGTLPAEQIDHVNMNRSDNRLCNLRLASIAENNRNRTVQSNSKTGHKGVTFHRGTGKFQAKICANKKTISLGYFADVKDAAEAYQRAAREHHGEFANY